AATAPLDAPPQQANPWAQEGPKTLVPRPPRTDAARAPREERTLEEPDIVLAASHPELALDRALSAWEEDDEMANDDVGGLPLRPSFVAQSCRVTPHRPHRPGRGTSRRTAHVWWPTRCRREGDDDAPLGPLTRPPGEYPKAAAGGAGRATPDHPDATGG